MKILKLIGIIGVLIAALFLIIVNLPNISSESRIYAFSSFFLIIAIVFLGLLLINKYYNNLIGRINPVAILLLGYLLLSQLMIFRQNLFSIEWAFMAFAVAGIVFYDFRIESRFMILPALLLLGYIPFLLIAKQNTMAETAGVYVYYFLVVGIIMQIMENVKHKENSIDFAKFIKELKRNKSWVSAAAIIIGFIVVDIILINKLKNVELWKWSAVYVFIVCLIFYLISNIKDEEYRIVREERQQSL